MNSFPAVGRFILLRKLRYVEAPDEKAAIEATQPISLCPLCECLSGSLDQFWAMRAIEIIAGEQLVKAAGPFSSAP